MDIMTQKRVIEVVAAIVMLLFFNFIWMMVCKKPAKRLFAKVFRVFTCILGNVMILLMLLMYIVTDTVLYYPHKNDEVTDGLKEHECMEELLLETSVGTCSGWFYHSSQESELTVILYPGNMQTAGEMMYLSGAITENSEGLGINLAALDYPGYGDSEGSPSETTIKAMALDAFDGIAGREDMQGQKVVMMAYSLGTGVANYVASKREVDGLVLMAPYQNGYDLFNGFVDIFHGPLKLFIPYRMRADRFAGTVGVKPLVLATKDDEMVPFESSLALSERYPAGCVMKTYDGLGHGGFWQDEQVWQDVFAYLTKILY